MSILVDRAHLDSLFLAAQSYVSLGYSVIPVYGDANPEKAKVAAIQWKNYQYRRPQEQDLSQWFHEDCHLGLAIITGRISNLLVIDFDSAQLEQKFALRFPHLMETRIITSANRGLSHYYYNITNNITIKSAHLNGADILSDGCYVLAPPTRIDGKNYKIKRGGMPYILTSHDANLIEQFFQQYQIRESDTAETDLRAKYIAPLDANSNIVVGTRHAVSTENDASLKNISAENLIQLYRHYAPQMGRNNALFKVGCYARDAGWNLLETEFALIETHIQQVSSAGKIESTEQRRHEAQNTLKSVFKRPARQIQHSISALPTSVREALLKSNQAAVARVLDGLFLKGIQSGTLLSEKDIKDLLFGVVGRHSILSALKACFDDHTPIFSSLDPSPRTPSHTAVACKSSKDINKKCFLFSATESDKKRGRPAKLYLMPDVNVLCAKLGVPFTRSDTMETEDIHNPKTYRQAVHRELIKRRPGMYSRAWLAGRLGISRRTCQRYDEQIKIQRKAMYIETMVTWDNLHEILSDEASDGTLLRDSNGKRYPAKPEIAKALMARGLWVTHLQQDHNYYWFGDNLPIISVHYGVHPQQEKIDAQREKMNQYIRDYWDTIYQQAPAKVQKIIFPYRKPTVAQSESEEKQSILTKKSTIKRSKRYYRAPLADGDAENLANRLVRVINQQAKAEKSRLSHANARRVVEQYGMNKINQVIQVLQSRQSIHNPAGFAMMWLRSSAQAG